MDTEIEEIVSAMAKGNFIQKPKIISLYKPEGVGLIGRLTMIEVVDEADGNNKESATLSIVIKQSPGIPEMHENLPITRVFLVEILFYTKVAPALRDFQLEYGINCLNFIECLYTNDTYMKETLVFKNLTKKGYSMLDHSVSIKAAHIKMAFEELAKLHGLCYALKKLKPTIYDGLVETLHQNTFFEIYTGNGIDAFLDKMAERFRKRLEGTKYHKIFCEFSDRMLEEFITSNSTDEYGIFCHGDSWINNIMFTHDASGNPTSAQYIDFQLNRIQSPVTDLSYLFYGCADIDLLPRLKEFLQYYHTTLTKTLSHFGLKVDEIYPWEKLIEHWKTYGRQGFIASFVIRVIMMSTAEEKQRLSGQVDKDVPGMVSLYFYKMKREEEYNQIMEAIVRHFIDEIYFC